MFVVSFCQGELVLQIEHRLLFVQDLFVEFIVSILDVDRLACNHLRLLLLLLLNALKLFKVGHPVLFFLFLQHCMGLLLDLLAIKFSLSPHQVLHQSLVLLKVA